MIRGATVTVQTPHAGAADRFGNATRTYTQGAVDNVLIVPGASPDLEAGRPEGVKVGYTLHFPKSYTASLEGCLVTLPAPYGGTYKVVGDPQPYMDANTPTPWNRPVEVEAAHG